MPTPAIPMQRGEDWGECGPLPENGIVVRSDAEARSVVADARRRGVDPPPLGLAEGDLARTLGGRGDVGRLHGDDATRLRIDVGAVLLDGRKDWFVAHLIARRSWLNGRTVAVMNAEWYGSWSLGPRAHPGDGLLDISDATLSTRQRLLARRRVQSGAHLPHPAIATSRTAAWQAEFERPLTVWLDGQRIRPVEHLSVRVEPGALQVVV